MSSVDETGENVETGRELYDLRGYADRVPNWQYEFFVRHSNRFFR